MTTTPTETADPWAPLDIVIERVFDGLPPELMQAMLDDLAGVDLYAATVAATGIDPIETEVST